MIRYLSIAILLLFAANADACNRCGRYGSYCRFAYAPTVYTPPNQTQNFIFNNPYAANVLPSPTGLLSLGNTVYGSALTSPLQSYSLSALPFTVDVPLYLDRSARFTQLAMDAANRGRDGFNDAGNLAMQLAATSARNNNDAAVALTYLQTRLQGPVQGGVQSFKVTVDPNGQPTVSSLGQQCANGQCEQPQQQPQQEPGTLSMTAPLSLDICAKCHDGQGSGGTPMGSVLNSRTPISPSRYPKIALRLMDGEMPPKSQLNMEQRASLVAGAARQLER